MERSGSSEHQKKTLRGLEQAQHGASPQLLKMKDELLVCRELSERPVPFVGDIRHFVEGHFVVRPCSPRLTSESLYEQTLPASYRRSRHGSFISSACTAASAAGEANSRAGSFGKWGTGSAGPASPAADKHGSQHFADPI